MLNLPVCLKILSALALLAAIGRLAAAPPGQSPDNSHRKANILSGNNMLLPDIAGGFIPPSMTCFHVDEPVQVDGVLSEPVWASAQRIRLVDAVLADRPVHGETEVRLLWDDEYLYAGFEARDADIWATLKAHDQAVCAEEALELFVDPDGGGQRYVEIEINALNTIFDLWYAPDRAGNVTEDASWNVAGLLHAVTVEGTLHRADDVDRGWTAELALPWSALCGLGLKSSLPPGDGDIWRANLYRIERPRRTGQAAEPTEYTSWSPPGEPNFHRTGCFGKVEFRSKGTNCVTREPQEQTGRTP